MATAAKPAIETFSFNGETVGEAGAAALRKVRSLADSAPPGGLFAAIATLSDTSAEAARAFEAAGLAELNSQTADSKAQQGMRQVKRLQQAAGVEGATPLPAFIRLK